MLVPPTMEVFEFESVTTQQDQNYSRKAIDIEVQKVHLNFKSSNFEKRMNLSMSICDILTILFSLFTYMAKAMKI